MYVALAVAGFSRAPSTCGEVYISELALYVVRVTAGRLAVPGLEQAPSQQLGELPPPKVWLTPPAA